MNETLLIVGMALVTFGTRYPVLAVLSKTTLPERLLKALKYVPPTVLTAIIVPALLLPDGELQVSYTNAPLAAGSFAALVAWRSKSLLLTISLGMAMLWGWRTLF